MIRGLYTTAAAMLAQMLRQQALAQNLANFNTPGYRQDRVTLRQFPLRPISVPDVDPSRPLAVSLPTASLGDLATGVLADMPGLSMEQGALRQTGEMLDLAAVGPGFFAVRRADGVFFTRDGRFTRNADGFLSSPSGGLVLGPDLQPIQLPGGVLAVDERGVIQQEGQVLAQVGSFTFPPEATIEKVGASLLRITGAPLPVDPALTSVHQGFVESSNVDVTQTTVEVMGALRSYQASQRLLQIQDQLLERVVTEIGRVG